MRHEVNSALLDSECVMYHKKGTGRDGDIYDEGQTLRNIRLEVAGGTTRIDGIAAAADSVIMYYVTGQSTGDFPDVGDKIVAYGKTYTVKRMAIFRYGGVGFGEVHHREFELV